MKILILILFLGVIVSSDGGQSSAWACEFKAKRPVLSLSGPVTHLFYRLGLFQDSSLKMISVFHGFNKEEFPGEIVGGGLFLSPKFLRSYKDPIVFYDENREQSLMLGKIIKKDLLSIPTLGDPFQVYEASKKSVFSYLQNCEDQWKKLDLEVSKIRLELLQSLAFPGPVLFFLGIIEKDRRAPNLLMVRDGLVLFWLKEKKLKTYPSPLRYVTWADKILQKLEKDKSLIKVGLINVREKSQQLIYELRFKFEDFHYLKTINVYGPSLLIPGLPQIYFMKAFKDQMNFFFEKNSKMKSGFKKVQAKK